MTKLPRPILGACMVDDDIQVHRADQCSPPVSAKDAVATMIKRLAHRNANVQLYTLEVRLRVLDLVGVS